MSTNATDSRVEQYARMFRLILAAKEEAETLQMRNLVHLANITLLQLALDWEGLDPDRQPDAKLEALLREKARIAKADGSDANLFPYRPH